MDSELHRGPGKRLVAEGLQFVARQQHLVFLDRRKLRGGYFLFK